MLENKEK